jgi:hypothetical protein
MDFIYDNKTISIATLIPDFTKVIMGYLDTGEDINADVNNGDTIL